MKKTLLIVLLTPAVVHASSIDQTIRDLNNNRAVSAAKAAVCFMGGIFAINHSSRALIGHDFILGNPKNEHNRHFPNFVDSLSKCIATLLADRKLETIERGVVGFGLGYVAWKLFGQTIKYANHAFNDKR